MGIEIAQDQDGQRGCSKPRRAKGLLKTQMGREVAQIGKKVAHNQDGIEFIQNRDGYRGAEN